jgi:pimeloyl-ACP methyl ester carboxylesterase
VESRNTHTYVLVAGAWHGGWVWRDVIRGLRERGHAVTAPTLTGLGERHRDSTDAIDLSTHIDDVVAHIEMEGLESVTLVGWSYGGMVTAGVTSRIPDKIKSLIYVDAFVPEDGKALVDYLPPARRAHYDQFAKERRPIPPARLDSFGLTDPAIVNFVTPRLTAQPWRTFYEPVGVRPLPSAVAMGYVYCSSSAARFQETYEQVKNDRHFRTAVIETDHFCMLSEPLKTIDLLADFG